MDTNSQQPLTISERLEKANALQAKIKSAKDTIRQLGRADSVEIIHNRSTKLKVAVVAATPVEWQGGGSGEAGDGWQEIAPDEMGRASGLPHVIMGQLFIDTCINGFRANVAGWEKELAELMG